MEEFLISYRLHAIQRMFERNVNTDELRQIIDKGKVIEKYVNDSPFPSKLILGKVNNRPLHVVVNENKEGNNMVVITVYEPDPRKWIKNDERR
jgi:hypothetical protein